MVRRKKQGRQDCIILSGSVYASSPTGVRALLSLCMHALPERVHRICNDSVKPQLKVDSQLELVGL